MKVDSLRHSTWKASIDEDFRGSFSNLTRGGAFQRPKGGVFQRSQILDVSTIQGRARFLDGSISEMCTSNPFVLLFCFKVLLQLSYVPARGEMAAYGFAGPSSSDFWKAIFASFKRHCILRTMARF